MHTRARGGLRLLRCGGGRGGGCRSRLAFGLPIEQALAYVTAFAHHGQQVVLEMLAAVGAGDVRVAELSREFGAVGSTLKALAAKGAVTVERRRRMRGMDSQFFCTYNNISF